jgi:hypothetical protein
MSEKLKSYPNPKFTSLEEERKYWEAHGPLAEGYKGKIQRSRQKRSSFLAVRMTGEELTKLRDIAAKQGLGPSTFARIVLTSAIEHQGKSSKLVTLDELIEKLPQTVKEKAEEFTKAVAIGDPNRPSLIIMNTDQLNKMEELTRILLGALLSAAGVQLITSEDKRYEEMREVVKAQT